MQVARHVGRAMREMYFRKVIMKQAEECQKTGKHVSHYSPLSLLMSLIGLKENFTFEEKCSHKSVGGNADTSQPWKMGRERL